MTSTEIIEQALFDGVIVSKNGEGQLKLEGDQAMVSKWIPAIRKNKNALLAALSVRQNKTEIIPPPCRGCGRLEIVEIMGTAVSGCLYQVADSEFAAGWKRLPVDIEKCIHHQ